jgi:hypothetical protein
MQKIKQHPRAAGVIAAILNQCSENYAVNATAKWKKDGLWIEGTFGDDQFEALICYNSDNELVVNYAASWFSEKKEA